MGIAPELEAEIDRLNSANKKLRAALVKVRDNCHDAVSVVATVNAVIGLPPLKNE